MTSKELIIDISLAMILLTGFFGTLDLSMPPAEINYW
jgi:hypothetical protein